MDEWIRSDGSDQKGWLSAEVDDDYDCELWYLTVGQLDDEIKGWWCRSSGLEVIQRWR